MENRQPTYPGRVILTPVPGTANTYDITRADEPTVDGTPLNKETLLQDTTCAILGIPNTSVPNDAFVKIALGIGKYGYVIHVQYQDGSPAEGYILTGLNAPDGTEAVTNSNGDAVGVSTEQSVTIGVSSPYVDIQDVGAVLVQSTGVLTTETITLQHNQFPYLISQSGNYYFSPKVKSFDLCAVGGGGGSSYAGGGGGYATNLLDIQNENINGLNIAIGAGGNGTSRNDVASTAGTGGSTAVKRINQTGDIGETLISSDGGGGAHSGTSVTSHTPGTGNGNGGAIFGSSGGTAYYKGSPGGDGTTYIFDEPDLGLTGGGGASGAQTVATPAKGGSPNGAAGGYYTIGTNTYNQPGTPIVPGGGAGGGMALGNLNPPGTKGASGGVYIRCHY